MIDKESEARTGYVSTVSLPDLNPGSLQRPRLVTTIKPHLLDNAEMNVTSMAEGEGGAGGHAPDI